MPQLPATTTQSRTSSSTAPSRRRGAWSLFRTQDGYRVVGTPPSEEELERALVAAGVRKGAAVEIGEESFEFFP